MTILFTDIVGSTGLRDALVLKHGNERGNEDYRHQILDPHNARIRGILEAHDGFEVKTIGDSFMEAFAQPEQAVTCAAAIQRSLRKEKIPTGDNSEPLAIRIGMHTGQATLVDLGGGKWDYDGHAVNIAARVESLAEGGKVLCSEQTESQARHAPGVRLHDHGEYTRKGLSERLGIFEVLWYDGQEPEAPRKAQEGLPYPWLTQWVGREGKMAELHDALLPARLVTLHGTGGVGKTRLAVETLLARTSGLPREVVFVPLEGASEVSGGLLGALRTALMLTEVDAPDLRALCHQLAGSDRLLLLDNFESVIAEAGQAHRLATTPGLRLLITSQQPLAIPGERVVELEPMETKGAEEGGSHLPPNVLTPEAAVEQLKALVAQIPEIPELTPQQRELVRRGGCLPLEQLQAAINVVGASEFIAQAVDLPVEEVRQLIADMSRWEALANEMKGAFKAVTDANLVRRQRATLITLLQGSLDRDEETMLAASIETLRQAKELPEAKDPDSDLAWSIRRMNRARRGIAGGRVRK